VGWLALLLKSVIGTQRKFDVSTLLKPREKWLQEQPGLFKSEVY
jgi:hypothetical protein